MLRGFFSSKEWRNTLITAGVTSLGSGAVAGMQDAGLINPRKIVYPLAAGLFAGKATETYLQGQFPEPLTSTSSLITGLNLLLSHFATPMFEGDFTKARAWTGMTLSCMSLGLAACIQPEDQVQTRTHSRTIGS